MKTVIIFSFFLVFPFLGLLSLVEEEKKNSIIAVKAVYDPSNPPGFGRAAHVALFQHFLKQELASLENEVRRHTRWQKEEIEVDVWASSIDPFLMSVLVRHQKTIIFEGSIRLSDFESDAAAASYTSEAVSQAIAFWALTHPESLRPRLLLAHLAPRHLPRCPGRASFL